MARLRLTVVLPLLAAATCLSADGEMHWTRRVRTGGHGLDMESVDSTVKSAAETHIFGIEADNDTTGRYDSFLDPAENLAAMRALAKKAHAAGNRVFVYTAGLECITPDAGKSAHTFFKDHGDWVQRDAAGKPAIFGGGTEFWIREGDEDVWISPFAPGWRALYMRRIREMAATGIDGVYVDVPYWMTHFEGWYDTWASFDDYTVAEFGRRTGLDARKDVKIGDFADPGFRKWVDFRIDAITEFMAEVAGNVRKTNPECVAIAEIYPGYGADAVSVGADVYELYRVCDVIAHETDGSDGNAAKLNPFGWFKYMADAFTFRAFAGDKPTWMLSYSWDKGDRVPPREPMLNLAMAETMAGVNCWDAEGHGMAGSNDYATRAEIYGWIAKHEKRLYGPRLPIRPVGVYFSPRTRNYFPDGYPDSFTGIMFLLMISHLEFQVVTPRTLKDFAGDVLILPDARILSAEETDILKVMLDRGKALVITGETGRYDPDRKSLPVNPVHRMLGLRDPKVKSTSTSPRFILFPDCPGRACLAAMRNEFDRRAASGHWKSADCRRSSGDFRRDLESTLGYRPAVVVEASPFLVAQAAMVDGKPHVFLANFKRLQGNAVAVQKPERDVRVRLPAPEDARLHLLPFLGEPVVIEGRWKDGSLEGVIPEIGKGGVVWAE